MVAFVLHARLKLDALHEILIMYYNTITTFKNPSPLNLALIIENTITNLYDIYIQRL